MKISLSPAFSFTLWAACLGLLTAPAALAADQPNVFFIAVDDLNDWIGPLRGPPPVKTPHLDHLAKRGITFPHAHCAAPLCNPSHAAVFSGPQPLQTGGLANDEKATAPAR